jgi:hypothetical protein
MPPDLFNSVSTSCGMGMPSTMLTARLEHMAPPPSAVLLFSTLPDIFSMLGPCRLSKYMPPPQLPPKLPIMLLFSSAIEDDITAKPPPWACGQHNNGHSAALYKHNLVYAATGAL